MHKNVLFIVTAQAYCTYVICDSTGTIPLCHSHYSCGVDFPILIELERLI